MDLAALGFAHGATNDKIETIALSSNGQGISDAIGSGSGGDSVSGNLLGNAKTIGEHKIEKLGKLHQVGAS